jgi:alanine racemase
MLIFFKRSSNRTGISYGGTYVTDRPTKVATIPVGYGMDTPEDYLTKVMC